MGHTQGLILIGGGGHAKVVLEALRAGSIEPAGFVDDRIHCPLEGMLRYLGLLAEAPRGGELLLAIGDVPTRRRVLGMLGAPGATRFAGPVIHPGAMVSGSVALGAGVFVGPGAIVNADARIGEHAIINSGAIVEHDCDIGINTHVAPGAVLGGGVIVGGDTLVGLGAAVLPGVRIGSRCVVGAGAAVVRDVGDGETVVGVPGRAVVGRGRQ